MKVRIIHQYFHPDLSATSQVISQVAFHLAGQQDEVSVLCSRNRYHRKQWVPLPAREMVRGVRVHRCWGPSLSRQSLAGRALNILSFCIIAGLRASLSSRVDTVLFMTDPPFLPVLGTLLKHARKERFVYVLMDIYPDVAVRAGLLREGSTITRMLRWFSGVALRHADAVVVLGEDMKEKAVRSGTDPEKIVVIRNWADPNVIFPIAREENRFRRELGLAGKFIVEYSGNLGVTHDFGDLLSVAEELESRDDIRFLIVGDGARLGEVKEIATSRRLSNIIFLPYQDGSSLAHVLSVGDVHFVSLRKGFEGLVVPSKVYGIMAAGRPLVYQGEGSGEIARMIVKEGIGFVVSPGDRNNLKDRILFLCNNLDARAKMGESSRRVLVEKFPAATGLASYRKVLDAVVSGSSLP